MRKATLALVPLLAFVLTGGCKREASDFPAFTQEFVETTLALSPTGATAAGYHKHGDVELDTHLDDYSAAGIEKGRATWADLKAKLERFDRERAEAYVGVHVAGPRERSERRESEILVFGSAGDKPGAPPGDQTLRMNFTDGGNKVRVEVVGQPNYTIMERSAHHMTVVLPAQHSYMEMPLDPRQTNGLDSKDGSFTRRGTERVVRFAFDLAMQRRKRVASITKSNAQGYSMVLWDRTFQSIASQYPEVETESLLVDAAAMNFIRRPNTFDVVVASNLFGDILSDCAAMASPTPPPWPSSTTPKLAARTLCRSSRQHRRKAPPRCSTVSEPRSAAAVAMIPAVIGPLGRRSRARSPPGA